LHIAVSASRYSEFAKQNPWELPNDKKAMSLICMGTAMLNPLLCISQSKTATTPAEAGQAEQLQPSAPATRLDAAECIEPALQNNNRSKESRDSLEMLRSSRYRLATPPAALD
jgi:hypothetical protein